MIYELAPGHLIQTDGDDPSGGAHVLDEEQLADARDRLENGQKIENIAKRLGATVYAPPDTPDTATSIAVDLSGLRKVLGDEQAAQLAGVDVDTLQRIAGDDTA